MTIDARAMTSEQVYELVKEYARKERERLGLPDATEEDLRCIAEDGTILEACLGLAQTRATIAGVVRAWTIGTKGPTVPPAPVMVVSGEPLSGGSPLTVQFYSNRSRNIESRQWDFGDGGTSTEVNPNHTYAAGGTYYASCTGYGPGGSQTSGTLTITVTSTPTPLPPIAIAGVTATSGAAPLTITFDGSASIDRSGGAGLLFSWDFGDLTASNNAVQAKTYSTPGTYRARLTVEDSNGLTNATAILTIVVAPASNIPPVAVASASPITGPAPLTVQFSSAGTHDPDAGPGSLTRTWTFGDGSTSSAASPAHTYTSPGLYTVDLAVSDGGVTSHAAPITISVTTSVPGSKREYESLSVAPDGRVVYVAADGSDANDGLTSATPKRTIAAGYALLRHQFPDHLCLRRGDTFNEGLGHWKKSGRSATERMVVRTYGDTTKARPRLLCPLSGGFSRRGGGASPARIDYIVIDGLEITPAARGNTDATDSGIGWLGPGGTITIQDCDIWGWSFNLSFENDGNGAPENVRLFRCIIRDARPPGFPHSSGLYAYDVRGLRVEECVLDHNGWSETIPNAGPTIFNHNAYFQGGVDQLAIVGCVSTRASSHGLSCNTEALIEDNVFAQNAVGLFARTMGPSGTVIRRNVVVEGRDISIADLRGVGIVTGPRFTETPARPVGPLSIASNIIAFQQAAGRGSSAIEVVDRTGTTAPVVIDDNVVYDWGGPIVVNNGIGVGTTIAMTRNVVVDPAPGLVLSLRETPTLASWTSGNNRFTSARALGQWGEIGEVFQPWASIMAAIGDSTTTTTTISMADKTRTLGRYTGTLGLPSTTSAYIAAARSQSKASWNDQLMPAPIYDWIRAGLTPS